MSARFLKNFFRYPHQVASVVPSSQTLVNRVLERIDFEMARHIVEFGAGEGVHSREIQRRMHPEARLLLFELNEDLADKLTEEFREDHRIEIVHDDASQLIDHLQKRGWENCDYILSGIPFSLLPRETKSQLIEDVYSTLTPEPHASFITYQVTKELLPHLGMFHRIITEYCIRNLPPLFVTSSHKLPEESPKKESPSH